MNRTTDTTRIGAFVLGALALVVAATIILGSGAVFRDTKEYILFFDGSVQGLTEGTPVVFRGVKVGRVKTIYLEADLKNWTFMVPVVVEIEPARVILRNDTLPGDALTDLVDKGLRAQLLPRSLITGQYLVNLDIKPGAPRNLAGKRNTSGLPEIPTEASPLELISETVQQLPLRELVQDLQGVLASARALIQSPDVGGTLSELHALVSTLNNRLAPLADEAHAAVTDLRALIHSPDVGGTLSELHTLVSNLNNRLAPLADEVHAAVTDLRAVAGNVNKELPPLLVQTRKTVSGFDGLPEDIRTTLAQARGALGSAKSGLDEDSPLMVQLRGTLAEVDAMSRSVRELSNFLKRYPDALIQGRTSPRGN